MLTTEGGLVPIIKDQKDDGNEESSYEYDEESEEEPSNIEHLS